MGASRSAHAGNVNWLGNSDSNIGTLANWNPQAINSGDTLVFGAVGPTTLNWDLVNVGVLLHFTGTGSAINTTNASGYTFNAPSGTALKWGPDGAGATILNYSTNTQTFNVALTGHNNSRRLSAFNGSMLFNGDITLTSASGHDFNVSGKSGVTLAGTTSASNHSFLVFSGSGTSSSDIGLLNISGSTTIASSASGRGIIKVGTSGTGGGHGTVNVQSGGSLTINGTTSATKGNSIIGDQSTGVVNVNGGFLTIEGDTGLVFGNSNGNASSGTLTIASDSSVTIKAGAFTSTARDIDTSVIMMGKDGTGATGVIDLNGGTLATDRRFVRGRGNDSDSRLGNATFNFNGGKLQALGDQTDWFSSGTYAVKTIVKSGGAVIDTSGYGVTINTVLAHDTTVTTDGGLTKEGIGTLTLGGESTYNGATIVNGGILALAETGSIASSKVYYIAAGATFDASVKSDYSLVGISTTIAIVSESSHGSFNAGTNFTYGGDLNLAFSTPFALGAGQTATFNLFSLAVSSNGMFSNVLVSDAALSGFTNSLSGFSGSLDGLSYAFDYSSGELTVSAIPEPSTYAAIAGALALGAVVWRRRRSHA